MANLSSVPQPSRAPEGRYGIGLTSFSQFIGGYTFDGTERTDADQLPLSVGDFSATQEGRKRFGPVMLRYLADRAIDSSDIGQAGVITLQAQIAEGSLRKLLAEREIDRNDPANANLSVQELAALERETRQSFGEKARRLRTIAFARRASEPLIDAALTAQQTFRDDDLKVLAEDAALAIASTEAPVELDEPLDRIYPRNGIAPTNGLPA